jgi:glycosyltransferase involved in cell wall biosynthesis
VKKILHIQLLPILSGVQNFSLYLLEGLPAGEYLITVASQPGDPLREEVLRRGWNYIPVKALRHPISPLDGIAFHQILRIIQTGKFDIVHTNSSKPGFLGRMAASLAKVPLVLHTCHGTPFQHNQHFVPYTVFAGLDWLANRFCHKVVFVNDSDRIHCVKMGLLPAGKASTIYNAIPPRLSDALDDIAAKREPRSKSKEFIIGSTFRFSFQKNVVETISAACFACLENPALRFIFLGDGEYLDLCKLIVRSHSLNDRILFPGWDNDISKWLPRFDALLLYSLWESQPFSVIEAMRSGLPVVAADIPSMRELVDEDCGWLVPLHDREALAKCLAVVSANPYTACSKGKAAQKKISGLCEYAGMLSAYRAIYEGRSS